MYTVVIDLPIDIKKNLMHRFGNGSDKIDLTVHNLLGNVFAVGSRKIGYQHHIPQIAEAGGLAFVFAGSELKRRYVDKRDVNRLKKALYHIVNEEIRLTCEAFDALGGSDYMAIKFYCDKYNINDDDIDMEALRKRYREWKRLQSQKLLKKV